MRIPINVLLEEDVFLNNYIIELRRTKKLSNHINNLLRQTFDIKKEIVTKDIEELDKEILEAKIKQAVLEEKKKNIILEEEKESKKWTTIIR